MRIERCLVLCTLRQGTATCAFASREHEARWWYARVVVVFRKRESSAGRVGQVRRNYDVGWSTKRTALRAQQRLQQRSTRCREQQLIWARLLRLWLFLIRLRKTCWCAQREG